MRYVYFMLFAFGIVRIGSAQIILTEVMFNPIGPENSDEFIEIYNLGNQAVDLSGWQIGDSSGFDFLSDVDGGGLILHAGQYGLILDPDYFANGSTTYDSLISPEALLLTIDGSTLGSGGLSNSTPETIMLIDAALDTVQQYRYTINNDAGHSDEKRVLSEDNSPGNWGNSLFINGTPGFTNSISPVPVDAAITRLVLLASSFIAGSSIPFRFTLKNAGVNPLNKITWSTFLDDNRNGVPESNEIVETFSGTISLPPGDSLDMEGEFPDVPYGEISFGISLTVTNDAHPENNVAIVTHFIDDPSRVNVVINEIMFEPQPDFEEWVELYNKGAEAINLRYLRFADSRDTVAIRQDDDWLAPSGFIVLGGDTALIDHYSVAPEKVRIIRGFPTLNNGTDDLRLIGPTGFVYDRVPYTSDWYGRETEPGVSLEKINPFFNGQFKDNWAASVAPGGSTPGEQNSVFVEVLSSPSRLEIQPNPFSPDFDGREDFTVIRYSLNVETAFINIRIYDLRGRLIRFLADSLPAAHQGQVVWDGRDDQGRMARIGAYICLFEALNPEKRVLNKLKKTIILVKQQ